jgi:hypothetical protein
MKKALKYFRERVGRKPAFTQQVKRVFSSFNPSGTGGLTALAAL